MMTSMENDFHPAQNSTSSNSDGSFDYTDAGY
jgi:hypothetical protein